MSTYAIVKSGGKQHRVEEGQSLLVERLPDDVGASVDLEPLLVAGGGDAKFSADALGGASVTAKVVAHERGPKVRIFKYRPKQGYRKRQGHRQELTRLEITGIKGG